MMADSIEYIGTYTTCFWITVNGVTYEEHRKRNEAAQTLKEMAGE
jgi:hypothetical protein